MSRGYKWYEVKIKLGKKMEHKGWGTVEVAILYYKGCQGVPLFLFIKKIKAFPEYPSLSFSHWFHEPELSRKAATLKLGSRDWLVRVGLNHWFSNLSEQ